jgi:hypothetical protein
MFRAWAASVKFAEDERRMAVHDDDLRADHPAVLTPVREGAPIVVELRLSRSGPDLLQELSEVVPGHAVRVECGAGGMRR